MDTEIKLPDDIINKIKEALEPDEDINEFVKKAVLFYLEESAEKEDFGSSNSRLRSLVDRKDD